MTSITEEPSLPLDLDGTSNQLANSLPFGHHDSMSQDITSSISSELEQPGTFRNLTSAGRVSPHRTRTMKDQEMQLSDLKKENFGLKLRIYHLEEALRKRWGDDSEGWRLNIELQVQLENMKKELAEKDSLLMQAKSAIDGMAAQHAEHIRQMQRSAQSSQTEELRDLEERLAEREAELGEALKEAEEANERLEELQAANDRLGSELRDKDNDLGRLEGEVGDLKQALAEKDTAAMALPPVRAVHSAAVQTTEPLAAKLDSAQAQLEAAQVELHDKDRAVEELQVSVKEKDKRIKELEIELLTSSQKLAAGANDHAEQMQDQADQLDKCKAQLRDADAALRQCGKQLEDQGRRLEEAQRGRREAEATVQHLQPLLQQREGEIQDLRRQLHDADTQARGDGQAKDREIQDLGRRLRDAESRAQQAQPELAAKDRELEQLSRTVRDKDEELSRLRSKLRESEEALSHARKSTHNATMEKQEQAELLKQLQRELEALKEQLKRQQDGTQHDFEAALAAKDAIIEQLRRDLREMQAKLDEADEKLLHLTTSKAAELGVLRGTIEDLTRQLEHEEGLVRSLKNDVGQLTGEKASLQREVEKLRAENEELMRQLEALQNELAAKTKNLEQAEQTIASLQKLMGDLQKAQPQKSRLEQSAAEVAQLRSQLASLEHALRNKEAEVESMMQTIGLKDKTIKELQRQLQRLMNEKARLEERVRDLEAEKSTLENEVAGLQSQARVSHLSSEDLQSKLAQAFGEREDLARRLKVAEEALREKGAAYDQVRAACESLQEQIKRLQRQLAELSKQRVREVGVNTSTSHTEQSTSAGGAEPGSSSTTMIFGSLSENLLLTILQRLQELYSEITAGRADSNLATSSLSSKLEHITELQRHLESSFHNSPPREAKPSSSTNTSYTTYYYTRGEDGASSDEEPTPKRSSTPRSRPSPKTTPKKNSSGPLHDAMQQISALQSELEEVKRWNEALRARLDETGRTRDVGVGMEKDGEARPQSPPRAPLFGREKYLELQKEVDRLLAELETERERSLAEKRLQERLQSQVREAEEKVGSLERQLRLAMSRDAATSTDLETTEMLQQEVEGLKHELDEAKDTIATMREQLEAKMDENQQLREELGDSGLDEKGASPQREDKATFMSTSVPHLLTPDHTPARNLSDSWTSPGRGATMGEHPEVRALREKHEEVTRLNLELQRKCQEQLKRSPPHSRPTSGGQSTLQSRLREMERLQSEMMERERTLLSQLRESEARFIEREGEWKTRESTLHMQVMDLESQLNVAGKSGENLQSKLAEALSTNRAKDEEIQNLTRSLARAQEKIRALEEQIDQVLAEKNSLIQELEGRIRTLEQELQLARERAERLGQTVEQLEASRGEGESAMETEIKTLRETVDSLSQQLTTTFEEMEALRRQNIGLEEHRTVLTSQLASCQEQIATLQRELSLYQKLLEESTKTEGTFTGAKASSSAGTGPQLSLSAEQILQLLEEVRSLRDQLHQSIRSNSALADQLRSRMEQSTTNTASEVHIHHGATPFTFPTRTTPSQAAPHTRLSEKSTGVHTPVSDKATSPLHPTPPPGMEHSSSYRTQRTSTHHHYHHHHSGTNTPPLGTSDIKLTSSATTSSHSATTSTPRARNTVTLSATNVTFTSPRDTSVPHFTSTRFTSGVPSTRGRRFDDSLQSDRVTRVKHISRGVNTSIPQRSRSDEFLTANGPTLDSSTTSFHSYSSTSRLHGTADSSIPRARQRPTSAETHGTSFRPPPVSLSAFHGTGDFDALELKLKQALDSPTLQGADRAFLEELLMYLRQQRRQLDESRRLLERLECQQRGIPTPSHVGAESGTVPAASFHRNGATGVGSPGEMANGMRSRGSKVNLSSLYEQLLKTHASLVEARSTLNQQQTQ